jgi:hypothetical protein
VIAAGYSGEGLVSQGSLSAAGGLEHGSDACRVVADKAWRLLYTVSILHIWACDASSIACGWLSGQHIGCCSRVVQWNPCATPTW